MKKKFFVKGKLHSTISHEALYRIAEKGKFESLIVTLHSARIYKRFKRLALENGADIKDIEAILREADRSPSELLRLINLYTEEEQ